MLTQAINWHWIFFINIPIGIATAIFGRRLLAADKGIGLTEGADLVTWFHTHLLADAGVIPETCRADIDYLFQPE